MLTRALVCSASRAPNSAASAGPLSSVVPRANQRSGRPPDSASRVN